MSSAIESCCSPLAGIIAHAATCRVVTVIMGPCRYCADQLCRSTRSSGVVRGRGRLPPCFLITSRAGSPNEAKAEHRDGRRTRRCRRQHRVPVPQRSVREPAGAGEDRRSHRAARLHPLLNRAKPEPGTGWLHWCRGRLEPGPMVYAAAGGDRDGVVHTGQQPDAGQHGADRSIQSRHRLRMDSRAACRRADRREIAAARSRADPPRGRRAASHGSRRARRSLSPGAARSLRQPWCGRDRGELPGGARPHPDRVRRRAAALD